MTATPLRTPRALSAGVLCGAGAVTAHVLAGGAAPPAWLAALAVLVGVATALPLTRRRLDVAGLAGTALLTQAGLHLALGLTGPAPAHDPLTMALAHGAAGAVTVAAALGAERAWWRLVRAALLRLLPPLPQRYGVPAHPAPLAVAVGATPATAPRRDPQLTRGPPRFAVPVPTA
ncbi:hypothetical protein ACOACO_03755 [Nocardioides sp. CPCC 205120]|uniref:hypothetical protein n=1 Tax=Nocardioides sp. CPCC 205120 TaxID=3406462 RepID=UPI003B51268F